MSHKIICPFGEKSQFCPCLLPCSRTDESLPTASTSSVLVVTLESFLEMVLNTSGDQRKAASRVSPPTTTTAAAATREEMASTSRRMRAATKRWPQGWPNGRKGSGGVQRALGGLSMGMGKPRMMTRGGARSGRGGDSSEGDRGRRRWHCRRPGA